MPLPKSMYLGQVNRPFHAGVESANQVRQPRDLPSRLILGSLVEDSFSTGDTQWDARYEGNASEITLKWDGERLSLSQRWFTRSAATWVAGSRIADTVQAALPHQSWLQDLPAVLDPPLNVFVETGQSHRGTAIFYPDGLFVSVLVPLPVARLAACPVIMDDLQNEPPLLAPLSAGLQRAWSVVNYIEGRCSGAAFSPTEMDELTAEVFGLPPVAEAQFERRRDGEPGALTVRRQHYQLVVNCFFCDLTLVLARLMASGIVAVHTPKDRPIKEEYPAAPEYSAIVLPALIGPAVRQLVFFDDARTRRVVYPGPIRCVESDSPPMIDHSTQPSARFSDRHDTGEVR